MRAAPSQPTLGERLAAFGKRYELSTRQLSAVCGGPAVGVSKSTTDRLYRGSADIRLHPTAQPLVIQNISEFLQRLGKTANEIQAEIKSIFPEQETTMIAARTSLQPAAQRFFGLRRDPFALTSDPRQRSDQFTFAPLDAVAASVEDAINYQGFLAVIGDIGSGKTILKRRINELVATSNGRMNLLWPKFSVMERVEAGAIVTFLLESFEQRPRRGLVASQRQLEKLLAHLHEQGVRVALGFDEAHHLNDTTLLALKNFYELGTGGYDQYLGIVLFGQPVFRGRMNDYRFREIAERLEIIEMPGLGKYAWEYLSHRIKLVGGDPEKLFEREAVKRLAAQSETPLALGNLANAALRKAYSINERKVLAAFIKKDDGEPQVRAVRRAR